MCLAVGWKAVLKSSAKKASLAGENSTLIFQLPDSGSSGGLQLWILSADYPSDMTLWQRTRPT